MERSLAARLDAGPLLVGQGYVFELARRGSIEPGPFVPSVVLERPEAVRELHREHVDAGSDVVEALTYYAHRAKLESQGLGGRLRELNRTALSIARDVAHGSGALFAGNVCDTQAYEPEDASSHRSVRQMYDEQVAWAAEAGVDYVIGETLSYLGEAELALAAIREAGLPAVITLAVRQSGRVHEGIPLRDAARRLEDGGAAVVGLNCFRGPRTMEPLVGEIRAAVSCPVAALPVAYRTTAEATVFQDLVDDRDAGYGEGQQAFPDGLDPFACTASDMASFVRTARRLGVRYLGGCCGTAPHHVRAMRAALDEERSEGGGSDIADEMPNSSPSTTGDDAS
jgi:betaine-homocysteine S-methyltransferase